MQQLAQSVGLVIDDHDYDHDPVGEHPNEGAQSARRPEGRLRDQLRGGKGWLVGWRHDQDHALGHDATYNVTVLFTSTQAADLAYRRTSVPVGAGQTKPLSATATSAASAAVLCVLRGVVTS
jgi:hypothetical protein